MTKLHDILLCQIGREGPISVAEYMRQCLYHPNHGYYTNHVNLGGAGDFITAPEISQMFGEVLGLCLAQTWLDQGAPNPCCLAEIGPGNGTLMDDILRATAGVPGFHAAIQIVLIEVSPNLRTAQQAKLAGHNAKWIDSIADLPAMPSFIIGNEFFDCLPIRQFRRTDKGWQEQMIDAIDGKLAFSLGAVAPEIHTDTAGDFLELSSGAAALCAATAKHIQVNGGCALFIDYGDAPSQGDTLQAVQRHHKVDPLSAPGECDLTAHVDFSALRAAAQVASPSDIVPQGVLLERLGITARAQQLAKSLSGDALENHISAHRRLTHSDEMGTLFKSLAIVPRGAKMPIGFIE